MSLQNFVDRVGPVISADWLNQVDVDLNSRLTSKQVGMSSSKSASYNRGALQDALNSGLGRFEFVTDFAGEVFQIDGAVEVPGQMEIEGFGRWGSCLSSTDLDAPIFKVMGNNVSIRGMHLAYAGTPLAGANAIEVLGRQWLDIYRLWVSSAYNAIYLQGGGDHEIVGLRAYSYENCGLLVDGSIDVNLSIFRMSAYGRPGLLGGLRLFGGVEAFTASQGDITLGRYGITCDTNGDGSRGTAPFYNRFSKVFFDSPEYSPAYLRYLQHTDFESCWFASAGHDPSDTQYTALGDYPGIDHEYCQHLRFLGGDTYANGGNGVNHYANSKHISYEGMGFKRNGRWRSAERAGINILAGATDFSVKGCPFERDADTTEFRQSIAVNVNAGASDRYLILGNTLGGCSVIDGGTGTDKVVVDATSTLQGGRLHVGAVEVGVGESHIGLYVNRPHTETPRSVGIQSSGPIESTCPSTYNFLSGLIVDEPATITQVTHYHAYKERFDAGATLTTQYGFAAASSLVDAVTNIGFFANLSAATGRWNFYGAGTAANHFNGETLFGTNTFGSQTSGITVLNSGGRCVSLTNLTADATAKAGFITARHYTNTEEDLGIIAGYTTSTENIVQYGGSVSGSSTLNAATSHRWITAGNNATLVGTERMRLTSSGALGIGVAPSDGLRLDVKQSSGSTGADVATSFVRRTANHSGGTAGFVSAAHRVETVVSAGATNFEWAQVAVLTNAATAGENVASYAQGNKTSTGPTWAAVAEAIDTTSTANPTTGLVALEIDVRANGTDSNNNRLGIDIVATRQLVAGSPSGAAMAAGFGVRLQHGGDASAQFTVGFDTSAATIGQAAFKMAQEQAIAFNANATRQLYHNGSSFVFANPAAPLTYWSLNDDRSLVVQGTQILGARATGWGAPTGTATRTTFDTSTVTLEQLAQRVKGLIDDITTHGLIGA